MNPHMPKREKKYNKTFYPFFVPMKHYTMRWTFLKVFVRLVIILFIVVTGLTAVMYLNTPTQTSTTAPVGSYDMTTPAPIQEEEDPLDIFGWVQIQDDTLEVVPETVPQTTPQDETTSEAINESQTEPETLPQAVE